MQKNKIVALVFDIDGSIMPQGGPIDPRVGKIFRMLSKIGIKIGPATGKNCDYARGLACGVGTIWDFIIGENGAQFLETVSKIGQPVFKHRKFFDADRDLSIFAKIVKLDPYNRQFTILKKKQNYRPELKEAIISLFPPDKKITVTKKWLNYFEVIIKFHKLQLKVLRHSDGCIDIIPSKLSKKIGLDQVCRLYDCERRNILVVIDGVNDSELTDGTNIIAVGNANREIKESARKRGGFMASYPDGKGFAEGMIYFAKRNYFKGKHNKKIIQSIFELKII